MQTNTKGNLTEIEAQFLFLKNNFNIFYPIGDGNKIDLIVIFPNSKVPKRIQIKTSRKTATGFKFNAYTMLGTRGGVIKKQSYTVADIDYFATTFNGNLYLIPIVDTGSRVMVLLRLNKKYKNQNKPLFAEDYLVS
ncbi:MAG: hypothetical protein KAT66_00660 [Candidatus Lokiarchaeota archaeon]|nr:hypothetical protein [Candidatus Lokiarchaeota archaeon]